VSFSVVIPLYNKRDYIGRAIQSVLDQAEAVEELIVVDDGSTDGGGDVAETFGGKVRVIRQANAGEAAARNRGIAEASASHIAFLDADDRWTPDFLATIKALIAKQPAAAIYGTGFDVAEPDGTLHPALDRANRFIGPSSKLDYAAALAAWCFALTSSSTCVRAEKFRETGLFNPALKVGTDIDMWVRLYLLGGAAFDPRPCAVYHRDADNRSNAQPAFWDKRLLFLNTLGEHCDRDATGRDRRNLKRFLARSTYETLIGMANSDPQFDLRRAMKSHRATLGLSWLVRARLRDARRMLGI